MRLINKLVSYIFGVIGLVVLILLFFVILFFVLILSPIVSLWDFFNKRS